jgi:ElaB/YqjD/DUF883 family membrane-anchored ribosome-binding protein
MTEIKADGAANVALGKFESAAGEALGDEEMHLRGMGRQVGGHVQEAAGVVKATLEEVAEQASAAFSMASDAYRRVSQTAQGIARRVDPFVEQRPYVALCLAAAGGLFVGLLIAGRGPKVIYVKPRT